MTVRRVFSGMDRGEIFVDVASLLFGMAFAGLFIWRYGYFNLAVGIGFAVLVILAFGARWRLTIDRDGILLERWRFFFVPRKSVHFLLDARFDLYWPWESDKPEGLTIDDYVEYRADLCFGPSKPSALNLLMADAEDALTAARAAVDAEEYPRPELLGDKDAFDWKSAGYGRGRLRTISSVAPVEVDGLTIPSGSLFSFNPMMEQQNTAWMDPRRADLLGSVELSEVVDIPEFGTVGAGSKLGFHRERLSRIEDSAGGGFAAGPYVIDGRQPIDWRDGKPVRFVLGEAVKVGEYTVGPGSTMEEYFHGGWRFELAQSIGLPEFTVEAGEHLHWDESRITHATLNRDLPVGRRSIKARELIFLKSDGRIDVGTCKKVGVLK